MQKIWDKFLTEKEQKMVELQAARRPHGLGKHPLLLIIDCQPNYVGADKPIEEQLSDWPSGGGENAWKSVRKIKKLRAVARENHIPVFYTKNVQRQTLQFDSFSMKTKRDQTKYMDGNPASDLLPELTPAAGELVIPKAYPSAFYGTPLLSYFVKLGVDTLIITGNSTSGCCRQTAVDAVSMNFKLGYVLDCITDRIEASHKIGMLDMYMNYGDVLTSEEIVLYFQTLERR